MISLIVPDHRNPAHVLILLLVCRLCGQKVCMLFSLSRVVDDVVRHPSTGSFLQTYRNTVLRLARSLNGVLQISVPAYIYTLLLSLLNKHNVLIQLPHRFLDRTGLSALLLVSLLDRRK